MVGSRLERPSDISVNVQVRGDAEMSTLNVAGVINHSNVENDGAGSNVVGNLVIDCNL